MKITRAQKIAAVVLTLGVLGTVGVRLGAAYVARQLAGPDFISTRADRVYLQLQNELLELSPTGDILHAFTLSELGIDKPITDLQAAIGGVLIGERDSGRVAYCQLAERRCRTRVPAPGVLRGQFKFATDATDKLYVVDTEDHRVLVQYDEGTEPRALTGTVELRYPSGVWSEPSGELRVADTNHHRVLALRTSGNTLAATGGGLNAIHPHGRPGRVWPVAVAPDFAGNWWVINADRMLTNADVVTYDSAGRPLRRIELPKDADPRVITPFGMRMLVADPRRMKIYDIDATSGAITEFGDHALRERLSQHRTWRNLLEAVARNALWALAPLGLFAVVLAALVMRTGATRTGKTRTAKTPAPETRTAGTRRRPLRAVPIDRAQGVRWVAADPARLADAHKGKWMLITIALAFPLALALMFVFRPEAIGELKVLAFLSGYFLVALVVLLYVAERLTHFRIGSRGSLLYFANDRGMAIATLPEEVVYTDRIVGFKKFVVIIKNRQGQYLFPPHEIQREIQPLLARGRRVSEINMLLYQLLHRQPLQWWSVVILLVGVVLLVQPQIFGMIWETWKTARPG